MKRFLHLFFFLRTVSIFVISYVFIFGDTELQQEILEEIPGLQLSAGFIGLSDYPIWSETSQIKKNKIISTIGDLIKESEKGSGVNNEPFQIFMDEGKETIVSPIFTFDGAVSESGNILTIQWKNSVLGEKKTRDISSLISESTTFSLDVGLDNGFMSYGTNTYTFELLDDQKNIIKKIKKQIVVRYQDISLGKNTLYIDKKSLKESGMLWNEEDFDGDIVSFLTSACDVERESSVLFETENGFMHLPGCLTYSLDKEYLLYFDYKKQSDLSLLFDIYDPLEGLLVTDYSLYTFDNGNVYFSLPFYNPYERYFHFLSAIGDVSSYTSTLKHYNIDTGTYSLELIQIDGTQIEISTGSEKIILYLYKDGEKIRNLSFPGVRYQYFKKRGVSRRRMKSGTLYHLGKETYAEPEADFGPSYTMQAYIKGDSVFIEDSFKRSEFSLLSLSNPLSVTDLPVQKFDCDEVTLGAYDVFGNKKRYGYTFESIYILGSHRHVGSAEMSINGSEFEPIEVNPGGSLSSIITQSSILGVQEGENIFTVRGYNTRRRKVCTKTLNLDINAPLQ